MQRGRRIVAAALGGGAITALTVATLALGAGTKSNALVTLQVAPRGPGSVSAVPTPSAGDPHPCTGHDAENDCKWSYEQGTSVRLNAVVDPGAGKSFFGWSEPDCGTSSSCTVRVDDQLTSVVAAVRAVDAGREVLRQRRRRHRVGQPCRGCRAIRPRSPATLLSAAPTRLTRASR